MHILFDEQIFSSQKFGGISRYYTELVKALETKEKITVKLLSPLCTNHYARKIPRSCRVGIPFPSIAGTEKVLWHFNRKFSNAYIKHFRPDILHQTYYPNRNPKFPSGLRIVTTVHDMIHELFPQDFPDAKRISELKLRAVESADLVICVSENTRKDLIELTGIEKTRTTVIHHGVDHIDHVQLPATRPQGKPYLVYVGLRATYKNFQRVLKAYARSPELMMHFDLVCFGGGALSQAERTVINKLKIPESKIIMSGGDDSVLTGVYQRASAFLYPSLYEGFGIPPLEAMAQRCPVISSNTSSLPEVLENAAEYFDPRDTDDLINAITRVVNNPKRSDDLMRLGLAHVQKFTWQRCAEKTLLAYQGILED